MPSDNPFEEIEDFASLFGSKVDVARLTLRNAEPNTVEFHFPEGKITIRHDGTVEFSEGLHIDEAARVFWERLSFYGAEPSLVAWRERVKELKEVCVAQTKEIEAQNNKIKELESEIEKLKYKSEPELVDRFDLEE